MEGPRACRPDELDSLRTLENTVFRSSDDSCMFREFPTLFHESNCDRLRVIVEDGRPVSAIAYVARRAVIHGNTLRIGSLGAVATYEENRGRGFATALLEDTFEQMKKEKLDLVLISGQRGLYQRAGCAIAGHEMRFSFDPAASTPLLETGITVDEARDEDVPALVALHQNEPVRFIRSPWEWHQFLSVYRITPRGAEPPFGVRRIWVVKRGEQPLAYFVLSVGRDPANPSGYVQEFAGSRRALLSGMAFLSARIGLRSFTGSCLPCDFEMLERLTSAGMKAQLSSIGGHRMSFLAQDILRRYDNWVTERAGSEFAGKLSLEQAGGSWFLSHGGQRIPVGDLENTNAVLWGDALTNEHQESPADDLWRRVLPLPFLLPGMNYI